MNIQAVTSPLGKTSTNSVKRIHAGVCVMECCREPQFEAFPTCELHSWQIWAKLNNRTDSPQEQAAAEDAERSRQKGIAEQDAAFKEIASAKHRDFKASLRTAPGTIYYLQVEDKIKIGFTRDLRMRLQSYPPMSRLLATHPGTFQVESDIHRKFASDLAGRNEWFHASPELEAHIEATRQTFKQDHRVTA